MKKIRIGKVQRALLEALRDGKTVRWQLLSESGTLRANGPSTFTRTYGWSGGWKNATVASLRRNKLIREEGATRSARLVITSEGLAALEQP